MAATAGRNREKHNRPMSHAYTLTLFHVVFSTKERRNEIRDPAKLWAYVAGTGRKLGYEPLAVGGTENHLHVLLRLPAHVPPAEATQKVKANSSRWLREHGAWAGWQQGYGAFSVSPSNVDAVRRYIQNQPEHHRRRSFEQEFITLLARSGIAFNQCEVFE
jgi:REP element-mobilizing transposase RayT